ncbi:MAG: hypothetical protein ACLROW_07130 [Roseburia faecis]
MTFKIPFSDTTGVYFRSSKHLNEVEENEKKELLNKLCNLLKIEYIGYQPENEDIFAVKRENDYLLVCVKDEFLLKNE